MRPRYSSSPSSSHRTRSPVLYMRAPGSAPNGSGTKRSAVSPSSPWYPRATPTPATYSSPATPTGTGARLRSSTYTRTFDHGRPMVTRSGRTGPRVMVAHTVVSVGPYAFNTTRLLPHRRTSSGGSASPAEMMVVSASIPSSVSCASTDGVSVAAVMCCSRSSVRSGSSGSSRSRGVSTRVAPASSVPNTSHTLASKLLEAYCSTRLPGAYPCARPAVSAVLPRPRWCSSVPLGRPVLPDV